MKVASKSAVHESHGCVFIFGILELKMSEEKLIMQV